MTGAVTRPYEAVLFDLDGTLIDSAPDLAASANALRQARGLAPLPLDALRPMTSAGARGMIGVALGLSPGDVGFDTARTEFLSTYAQRLTVLTRVYPAIVPVIDQFDAVGVAWGIVTNKAARYTDPIVETLGLDRRARAVISGDTTAHAKPHPEPLFEAARRMGLVPECCLYVGDDLRDVQAGRAAGMGTVAVRWGYLGTGEPIEQWGADLCIDHPKELLKLLGLA